MTFAISKLKNEGISFLSSPLRFAIAYNVFLFFITYLLFDPAFRTSDDVTMMNLVSGKLITVDPEPHIMFTNILLGHLLRLLYNVSSSIPWYPGYFVFLLFISHCIIGFLLFRRRLDWFTISLYTFYFIIIGWQYLLGLQFTMVACLAIFAGGFLLLQLDSSSTIRQCLKQKEVLIGISLVVIGSLVRWESLQLATLLFVPILAIDGLRGGFKAFKVKAALFLVAGASSFIFYGADKAIYTLDRDWGSFKQYNELRAQFSDFHVLARDVGLSKRKQILDSIGWSINDYRMINSWFFMDEELYNIDTFEKFKALVLKQRSQFNPQKKAEVYGAFTSTAGIRFLTFLPLILLFIGKSRYSIISVIFSILSMIVVMYAMIYFLKPAPPRVFIPLMTFCVLTGMFQIDFERKKQVLLPVFLTFAGLTVIPILEAQVKSNKDQEIRNLWFHQNIDQLKAEGDVLYVSWATAFPFQFVVPFENGQYLDGLNILGLGVSQRAPIGTKWMRQFQIDDLYLAIYNRQDVRLMIAKESSHFLDYYVEYMREHYQIELHHRITKENELFRIHDFKSRRDLENLLTRTRNNFSQGNYQACIEIAQQALAFNYLAERFYNNMAAAYNQLGQYEMAIKACEKAIEVNPQFELARQNLEFIKQRAANPN